MKLFKLPFTDNYLENRLARLAEEIKEADSDQFDEYFKILIDYTEEIEIDDNLYLMNMWLNLTQAYLWWTAYYKVDNED